MSKNPEANIESLPFDKSASLDSAESLSKEFPSSNLDTVKTTNEVSTTGSDQSNVSSMSVEETGQNQSNISLSNPFQVNPEIPSLEFLNPTLSKEDRKINEELNKSLGNSVESVEMASTVNLGDSNKESVAKSDSKQAVIPHIDINFFNDNSSGSWSDILQGKKAKVYENQPKEEPKVEIPTSTDSSIEKVSQKENMESGSISRNSDGKIDSIKYADKTRSFNWDGDKLVSYTEVGSKGVTEFKRDLNTGKWSVDVGGIKVELPGGIELDNKTGVFKIELADQGKWKFESTDGQISMQTSTKDGAKILLDRNNRLELVTRADGTSIQPNYKNGEIESYTESTGSGQAKLWTKDGESWVSGNSSRKNFSVNEQGVTKFESSEGFEHTIMGSGSELIEGEGRAKLTVDDLGRVTKVEYANDPSGRVREVEYFGDSREIKRFSVTLDGVTHHQTRDSKDSNQWKSSTSKYRDYVGQAKMSEDGTFALKRQEGDGSWDTRWTDNTTTDDSIDSSGARSSFDDSGNIVRYKNENGYLAKAEYSSGAQNKIRIKDADGNRQTWSKTEDGTWTSDSSSETRKNMRLNENGDISFETNEGVKKTERIDGHTLVENSDGSKSEFNQEGQLVKVTGQDGGFREFSYSDTGELQSAWDIRRNEKRTVFERSANEDRTKIELSKQGKISFETVDGQSVEKFASGAELVRNAKGNLLKAKTQDGKTREFEYDKSGENLETIIDTRVNSKGELSRQVLTKQSIGQGIDSDVFVGKSHKGKDIVRKDVTVKDDGTYTYRNIKDASDTKPRFAQIGGSDSSLAAWDATINKDALERVTDVVNGSKSRHYEYFGNSKDIQKLTIKKDGQTHVWERDSASSDRWYKLNEDGTRPRNAWRGQVDITSNGIHMYRKADHYGRYANSWNATFPDGTQTKGSLAKNGTLLFKDDANKLRGALLKDGTSINVASKDGKNTMTVFNAKTEEATTWTEQSGGKWTSDSPTATDTRANLRFDERGALIFEDTKGRTSLKELDGRLFVNLKDGTKLGYDQFGQLEHVQRRGKIRSFNRENGQISSVTEKDSKGEVRTLFQAGGQNDTRSSFEINDNGDFSYQSKDGSKTVIKSNGLIEARDADGNLQKVTRENGSTREFKYSATSGGDKVVSQITDTRQRTNGSARVSTWTRNIENGHASNVWTSVTPDGKPRAPRKDIKVLDDGTFEYRMASDSSSDKPRIARLSGGDGTYMSESVEDGHYNLLEAMESVVERPRIARMEKMMKQFESRMADQYQLMTAAGIPQDQARRQLDDAMTKTYDHMTRLITTPDKQGQFHSQRQRVFLAENFMYHAAEPTTIEQGNTGTCWWESSYAVGMERNTNHLARFVTDIALTGQYKSTAGKPDRYGNVTEALHKMFSPRYGTVDLKASRNGFEFANGWSIETADRDSTRSPVSRIIDNYGPAVLGWRSQGRPNSGGHGEAWRILYMMTGRKVVNHGSSRLGRNERIKLLREGGYTASGGGHMWGYCMRKVGDEWHVIRNDQYQNRDRVIARVRNLQDWIDNGTRDNVRKTWRPYSPTNPDQQPYKIDDIRDETSPDRPNRPFIRFRPLRFFRPFRYRRR